MAPKLPNWEEYAKQSVNGNGHQNGINVECKGQRDNLNECTNENGQSATDYNSHCEWCQKDGFVEEAGQGKKCDQKMASRMQFP